jgi:hypothetical protein
LPLPLSGYNPIRPSSVVIVVRRRIHVVRVDIALSPPGPTGAHMLYKFPSRGGIPDSMRLTLQVSALSLLLALSPFAW